MDIQPNVRVQCPYCLAGVDLMLDASAGRNQVLVEDCSVCCQPMVLHVNFDDRRPTVEAYRESD